MSMCIPILKKEEYAIGSMAYVEMKRREQTASVW